MHLDLINTTFFVKELCYPGLPPLIEWINPSQVKSLVDPMTLSSVS